MNHFRRKHFLLLFMVLMIFSSVAYSIKVDQTVFVAPAGTTSSPLLPPWENSNGTITIPAGGTLSIGCTNIHVPENIKLVVIVVKGPGVYDDIEITDPCAPGSKVKDTQFRSGNTVTKDSLGMSFEIFPQPWYETFQITNNSDANKTCEIIIWTQCTKAYKWKIKQFEMLSAALYYDGSAATAAIDNIAIWHDSKTATNCSFTAPVVADPCIPSDPCDPNSPTGTWTQSYITTTPDTNDIIAQGGWLISCQSTDRGIYTAEQYDIGITTDTSAEGRYYLALHDRLRDEWVRFVHDEALSSDFDGNGIIDMADFGHFAEQWQQTGTKDWSVSE